MALNLVEVVLEKTDALRLLEEAYDAESGTSKGRAPAVDSVVEVAREKGSCGSLELALGLLRRSGRFYVEKGSAGRWVAVRRAVRQSTALVPVGVERRSTALVPVAAGQPSGPGFFPGECFSLVLTNPPFGKKSTIVIVNEEGELEKEDHSYERQDFWTSPKNKQLNFLQHVKTLLAINGRCAIVVPDNVLFEGGAGETVRKNLLQQFDVHTLLRLPTGIRPKSSNSTPTDAIARRARSRVPAAIAATANALAAVVQGAG